MTQVLIDMSNKHLQIVLKHGEETGLQFDDALIDLIEVHADNKANAVRATLQAVKDTGSAGAGKSVVVESEEKIAIQEVYPLAFAMPLDKPFTMFDVIETLPNAKVVMVTEDQMRGWGTPFSNWINKNSDRFKVVEGNPQPRQYIRYS